MQSLLDVNETALYAIEKYTAARLAMEAHGGASRKQLEECRSYAAEAIMALLLANPGRFRFSTAVQDLLAKRKAEL